MAAPALPENFGNYAIQGIEELIAPPPVSWLPVTLGWKLLAACAVALALWYGLKALRRWRGNRYRRDALRQLRELAARDCEDRLPAIAVLLKSTALAAWPRREVAPLSGAAWVAWLECAGAVFSPRSRSLLAGEQYMRGADVNAGDIELLSSEAAAWIRNHRGATP